MPEQVLKATSTIKSVARKVTDDSDVSSVSALQPLAVSDCMAAMEALLTTCMCNESEWSMSWVKMIRYVINHGTVPQTLQTLGLEIPKKFAYMLTQCLDHVGSDPSSDIEIEDADSGKVGDGGAESTSKDPTGTEDVEPVPEG